jgi:hypothetical protein
VNFPFPSIKFAALSLLLLAGSLPAFAQTPAEPMIRLLVQSGDTLISLSEKLLENPADRKDLARINKLNNQNYLVPGQTLDIPVRLLRGTAAPLAVSTLSGQVQINGKPASLGQQVPEGASVTTATASTVTLKRADGTQALVLPNSNLEVKKNRALSNTSPLMRTLLRMVTGGVEMDVTPSALPDHVTVKTATSIIGVRGTTYRVGATEAQAGTKPSSRVEVLKGAVSAAGEGTAGVSLTGGFGTKVVEGEAPLAPRKLLDAPVLNVPAALDEQRQRVGFAAVAGAAAYDVAISPANEPQVLLASSQIATTELEFPSLPNGDYSLRVRAIDAVGLQGLDARTAVRLNISNSPISLRATAKDNGQTLTWRYGERAANFRIQVADSQDFSNIVVEGQMSETTAQTRDLPAGVYYWRVGVPSGVAGGWRYSPTASFTQN